MIELKHFCITCNETKYITEIIKDGQGEITHLSCGHKIINDYSANSIGLLESIKWKHKRPGFKKPIEEGKERNKISGKTKRPARESFQVNRIKGQLTHLVEELNEEGEWEVVHDEIKSFGNNKE